MYPIHENTQAKTQTGQQSHSFMDLSPTTKAHISLSPHFTEELKTLFNALAISDPVGARGDIAVRTKLLRLLGKGFFRLLAEDGPELRDDALKLQFP